MSYVLTNQTGDNHGDNTPIEQLGLTPTSYNRLKSGDIRTIGQLLALQKKELYALRDFTHRHYQEIREKAIAHGFMDSEQPIGPFKDDGEIIQLPWQQVHILCRSENLQKLVSALNTHFAGQEQHVRIVTSNFAAKEQHGFVVMEWSDEVTSDFLGQLMDDDLALDVYTYRPTYSL